MTPSYCRVIAVLDPGVNLTGLFLYSALLVGNTGMGEVFLHVFRKLYEA